MQQLYLIEYYYLLACIVHFIHALVALGTTLDALIHIPRLFF